MFPRAISAPKETTRIANAQKTHASMASARKMTARVCSKIASASTMHSTKDTTTTASLCLFRTVECYDRQLISTQGLVVPTHAWDAWSSWPKQGQSPPHLQ